MISAYSPKACPPASRRSRPRTAAMGPGRVLLTRAFIGPGRSPRQSRTVLCDVLMHPGTAGAATGEHLTCRASRRAEQRQHGRLPGGEVDRQTDLDSYEQPRGGADEQHRDLVRLDVTTDARTACPAAAACERIPLRRPHGGARERGWAHPRAAAARQAPCDDVRRRWCRRRSPRCPEASTSRSLSSGLAMWPRARTRRPRSGRAGAAGSASGSSRTRR